MISGERKQVDLNQSLRDDESLWSRAFNSQQRLKRAIETGKKDHTGVMEDKVLPDYYQKIIRLCQAHQIRIIGVRFPAMKAYFAQLPAQKENDLNRFLTSLPFERILDYRDFTQDPTLYNNEDHLNRTGALKLLQQMEQDTGIKLKRS